MRNTIKLLSLSFIFLMASGCAQPAAPQQTPGNTAPVSTQEKSVSTEAQNQQAVLISNFAFSPETITVKTGTTVTWTNRDSVPHKILSDANPPAFSSDNLSQGDSYSFTFTTAGTFNYICQIHPLMKGAIVVTP